MRSSVVRRAAAVVDDEVAALCERSPFLNSVHKEVDDDMALFHRGEIQIGDMIGTGGFAQVFQVTRFDLVNGDDDDCNDIDDDEESSVQARRRRLQMDLQSSSSASSLPSSSKKYAIKLLKKKLLQNTKEFQHAAIDLAVESKYLSALQHAHIIKIRALAKGGTAAFKTGKHDDYFIVMDLLHQTLEQRIQTWQQQQQSIPSNHHYRLSLKYALQIADALQYLHEKAIVYRGEFMCIGL